MARPRKAQAERRDDMVGVRMTTAERVQIAHHAAALGISPADFLRRRGLSYRLPASHAAERARASLGAAFNRLGVNMNQIARHLNARGGWSAALERNLQSLLERINAEMDKLYGSGRDGPGPQL
jgi:Bacterial mobilisation protein (MobC)